MVTSKKIFEFLYAKKKKKIKQKENYIISQEIEDRA